MLNLQHIKKEKVYIKDFVKKMVGITKSYILNCLIFIEYFIK